MQGRDKASPNGFPDQDEPARGVRIAFYRTLQVETCTPGTIDRAIRPAILAAMRRAIPTCIPQLGGRFLAAVKFRNTKNPDMNFFIATPFDCARVHLACGFSGHGYKFCRVVGEIMADLVCTGGTRHDIGLPRLEQMRKRSECRKGGGGHGSDGWHGSSHPSQSS